MNAWSNFEAYDCNRFKKKTHNFHFCPCKSWCDQIWLWHIIGQGQPRVIIWIILGVHVLAMASIATVQYNATYQVSRLSVYWFWRRIFFKFLSYMDMAATVVMWPRPFEQLFIPKGPGGCIWNLVTIDPVVSDKKSFEIVNGWTDNGQTDNVACLYYKLPRSLRVRWAKKISMKASGC